MVYKIGNIVLIMEKTVEDKKFVWVRFLNTPTSYIFDAKGIELGKKDLVVVETEMGQYLGKVLDEAGDMDIEALDDIKPVLRTITEEDIQQLDKIKGKDKECVDFCLESIKARSLPMKLSRVEQAFDETKIIFYFTSETRVDFRELLKDLVKKCKTKIELRQIGARQEAAMLGGIGACGRELCCAKFLKGFQRISLKMAKDQSMTLNPGKISGVCGKLKCCLAYEEEAYSDLIEMLPRPGKKIYLDQGLCTVVSINVMNQSFIARTPDRRFVKAVEPDILTEKEYLDLTGQRAGGKKVSKIFKTGASEDTKKKAPKRSSRRRKKKRKK